MNADAPQYSTHRTPEGRQYYQVGKITVLGHVLLEIRMNNLSRTQYGDEHIVGKKCSITEEETQSHLWTNLGKGLTLQFLNLSLFLLRLVPLFKERKMKAK